MFFSLSPFAPESLVSRDGFGSPAPRQPAHLHNTQAESVVLNYYGIPLDFRSGVHLIIKTAIRHRVSREFIGSIAYRWRSLPRVRADKGRPVNPKMVPNGCCLGRSPLTNYY